MSQNGRNFCSIFITIALFRSFYSFYAVVHLYVFLFYTIQKLKLSKGVYIKRMSNSQLVVGEENFFGVGKLTSDVENTNDPSENDETNAAEILSEGEGVDEEGVREETHFNDSNKSFRFPLSRIKIIAKTVPSVNLINSEALVLIERACELFVRNFSRNVYQVTMEEGKKTVSRAHVDSVVRTMNQYEFLDGMLD
ncbi:hypothetical protein AHF37_10567 [Paragonimus kellicotti]|nr:hypothetical protein AHF37_10567 [Paragonimus kellicotti]